MCVMTPPSRRPKLVAYRALISRSSPRTHCSGHYRIGATFNRKSPLNWRVPLASGYLSKRPFHNVAGTTEGQTGPSFSNGLGVGPFSASNDLAVRRFQVGIGKSISTGEGIRRSNFRLPLAWRADLCPQQVGPPQPETLLKRQPTNAAIQSAQTCAQFASAHLLPLILPKLWTGHLSLPKLSRFERQQVFEPVCKHSQRRDRCSL
jgi:hypothetical protein